MRKGGREMRKGRGRRERVREEGRGGSRGGSNEPPFFLI